MFTRCTSLDMVLMDRSTYHEESPFLVVDLPSIDVARAVGVVSSGSETDCFKSSVDESHL